MLALLAGGWILPREFKILILTMQCALQLDLTASVPIDSSTKLRNGKLQTAEARPGGSGGKFLKGEIGWRSDEEKNNWTHTRHRYPGSRVGIARNARRTTGTGER